MRKIQQSQLDVIQSQLRESEQRLQELNSAIIQVQEHQDTMQQVITALLQDLQTLRSPAAQRMLRLLIFRSPSPHR